MRCKECLAFLAKLPDTDPGSFPAGVRAHLAECPRCSGRLYALRLLEEGTGLQVEPPAGFAESIAERHVSAPEEKRGRRPALRWVPLAAAAVLALIVAVPLVSWLAGGRSTATEVVRVHLTLDAPAALDVNVVGDWNDWNPKAQPMKRRDGRWEIILELQRGRSYQYQFLVNGDTWIPDPNGLIKVQNGFGGMNSLLAT